MADTPTMKTLLNTIYKLAHRNAVVTVIGTTVIHLIYTDYSTLTLTRDQHTAASAGLPCCSGLCTRRPKSPNDGDMVYLYDTTYILYMLVAKVASHPTKSKKSVNLQLSKSLIDGKWQSKSSVRPSAMYM